MYTTAAKNTMLDALVAAFVSAHSAYSASGASELSGGSPAYARKAITMGAAAGGQRVSSTQPVFDIPAGSTVRFIGFWTLVTGGTFLGMAPNGGSEFEFYVDAAADRIKLPNVAAPNNDEKVVFYNGTPPAPLVEGTVYWVVNRTASDFQVSATQGGAAIDLTAQAVDACVGSKIVEETFGAQGTHTVSSATLGLNN